MYKCVHIYVHHFNQKHVLHKNQNRTMYLPLFRRVDSTDTQRVKQKEVHDPLTKIRKLKVLKKQFCLSYLAGKPHLN